MALRLAYEGWALRSGAAPGADAAFEEGALRAYMSGRRGIPAPEVYLPWPGFEGHHATAARLSEPQHAAYDIAAEHHPAWDRLSRGARSLHARNVHQVLGPDVYQPVPVSFVLCWTPGARAGGGTGQAIRVAKAHGIRVDDLAAPATEQAWREYALR